MPRVKITLLGNPMSTQHIYGQRGIVRFMKADAKKLKAKYVEQINQQYGGDLIEEDVSIVIDLFFGDKRKRDWDNYHKLSMDSLEDTVLVNDVQIQRAEVAKYYDKENPRIELYIGWGDEL